MSTAVLPPGTILEGVFVLGGALEHGVPRVDRASVTCAGDQPQRLALAIAHAQRVMDEAGPAYVTCRDKLEALEHRLEEERFHLAVLGQFKRGKSTLLNALLGADVLPTSVIPLTAIPTFVQYGPHLSARVILQSGEAGDVFEGGTADQLAEFLGEYVT